MYFKDDLRTIEARHLNDFKEKLDRIREGLWGLWGVGGELWGWGLVEACVGLLFGHENVVAAFLI